MDQLFLANEVVAGPIENPERFRQVHQEFRNAWRPVGQMEEVASWGYRGCLPSNWLAGR